MRKQSGANISWSVAFKPKFLCFAKINFYHLGQNQANFGRLANCNLLQNTEKECLMRFLKKICWKMRSDVWKGFRWERENIYYVRRRPLSRWSQPVWPDWTIYCTLGNHSKPLVTINLPKSPTFLTNFCKCVNIIHFSSEIIFGQLLLTFGDFFWSHWKEATFSPIEGCMNRPLVNTYKESWHNLVWTDH